MTNFRRSIREPLRHSSDTCPIEEWVRIRWLVPVLLAWLVFLPLQVHGQRGGPALTQPPSDAPTSGGNSEELPAPQEEVVPPSGYDLEASLYGQPIAEVRVEGHRDVSLLRINRYIQTRAGRTFDVGVVQRDVHRMIRSGLFANVEPTYSKGPDGVTIVFRVIERPILKYVKIVGNYVSHKRLIKEIQLKVGDPVDPYAIEEARKKLEEYYHERGYGKARVTVLEGSEPGDRGALFLVSEGVRQRVLHTDFVGNTIVSDARLRTLVESRPGILWLLIRGKVDRKKIDHDVEMLTDYYRRLGFFNARISRELEFSETPPYMSPVALVDNATHGRWGTTQGSSWLKLTFVIDEGPRFKVNKITFVGNQKVPTEQLSEDLKLQAGEFFDQSAMDRDVGLFKDVYGAQGYVFADVQPLPRYQETPGTLDLVYKVSEGSQYRVGRIDVHIVGENPRTRYETVRNQISLRPGDIVDTREIRKSERRLKASGLFENNPTKGNPPKIAFKKPKAMEDAEAIAKRDLGIRGQSPDDADPQTVDLVILATPSENADEQSGESKGPPRNGRAARTNTGESSETRYVFRGQSPGYHRWGDKPESESSESGDDSPERTSPANRPRGTRLSSKRSPPKELPRDAGPMSRLSSQDSSAATETGARNLGTRRAARDDRGGYGHVPVGRTDPNSSGSGEFEQEYQEPVEENRARSDRVTLAQFDQPLDRDLPTQGPNYDSGLRRGGNRNPGSVPEPVDDGLGFMDPNDMFPDGGSPVFSDNGDLPELPLDAVLQEANTGRFMLGVGVNSNLGIVGQITYDEQNFDWKRFPTSWEDIRTSRAFRGDGQQLRIEAVPGSQVSRYQVSFREPFLFDTQVGLGLNGFYFQRFFRDWKEERLGGRVSLSYMLTPDLSTTVALRGEQIQILDPTIPTPPELAAVLGQSDLFSASLGLAHDTRDSAFLATEGHYWSASFEQAFGTYDFSKGNIELRHHFTLFERPDGSGRHVLTLNTDLGFTGNHTPIFENYFAGGFNTIRGFRFRQASPRTLGVAVGGHFKWLNTAEYMFPITADDMLRGVVFCDYGTVERDIQLNAENFRVVLGAGFRVTIPAMGPAPLAFDFAVPVAHADGDQIQNFSFFVGANY